MKKSGKQRLFLCSSSSDDFTNDDRSLFAHAVDWTPETGFSPQLPTIISDHFYPRPGIGKLILVFHEIRIKSIIILLHFRSGSGSHLGLTLILNANADDYHCSSTNSVGFKVLLHSPIETPKIADYGISITTGFESRVVVTPSLSDASEALRRVPKRVRQCIFQNEQNLSYYRWVLFTLTTHSLAHCINFAKFQNLFAQELRTGM